MTEISSPLACFSDSDDPFILQVHCMSGSVLAISCPRKSLTLIRDVKRNLEMQYPDWPMERQCLIAKIEDKYEPTSPTNREPSTKRQCFSKNEDLDVGKFPQVTDSQAMYPDEFIFQDHLTLGECGLKNGSGIELLVKDIAWREIDLALQVKVMEKECVDLTNTWNGEKFDSQSVAAIAWVLNVRLCYIICQPHCCVAKLKE